jgi:type VI secretion system protein ImpC
MIELDVQTRRKASPSVSEYVARYLVLGDFGGRSHGPHTGPAAVDRDNLDEVLARQEVNLVGTHIREIEDFHPDRLYHRFDLFRDLRDSEPEPPPPSPPPASPRPDLEKILQRSSLLEQIAGGGDAFEQYVRELARAHAAPAASNPQKALQKTAALGQRMRALLHHPRFQAVEAAWRGLDFVLRRTDDQSTRIHIAPFSREDLAADVLTAADLKATRLYALLHAREWKGVFGLYSFGAAAADIELLGRVGLLAGNANIPFIAEGNVDMGAQWGELRSIPEARYLGLALPRFLLRLPYGSRTSAIEAFEFEEMPAAPVHASYLWGNPALACLAILARGDSGEEEGDELDLRNLPLHSYQEDGEWRTTPCAEVSMTETEVGALMKLGLMPLVSFRDTDRVRLAGFRAINGEGLLKR